MELTSTCLSDRERRLQRRIPLIAAPEISSYFCHWFKENQMFSQHSGGINISVNGALGNRCLSSTECCAEVKCHPLLCPITPGHVITENNCIFQLL